MTGSPASKLYCGTSGFAYPSWKPGFYPDNLPSAKFLTYYAMRLNCVEVNYTYRRIASASTFTKWISVTPDSFLFLPKAHMKITHILKLKEAQEFTRLFLDSLEPLRAAGRLGPILFQLPPSFKKDLETLAEFSTGLPKTIQAAFEFRDESWFDEATFSLLRSRNIALCVAENEKLETPKVTTANFVYLRLRKPEYSEEELKQINLARGDLETFAIFKHEESPAGALNAEILLGLPGKDSPNSKSA